MIGMMFVVVAASVTTSLVVVVLWGLEKLLGRLDNRHDRVSAHGRARGYRVGDLWSPDITREDTRDARP